ncbi:MAG: ATP-binding protein [Bacteroidota bacterium]
MQPRSRPKVVFTGPESTGKTTLAQLLATHYNTAWVPEYARTYLASLHRDYRYEDLEKIAQGQIQWEEDYKERARNYLFCDTGLLVLRVWSEVRYGKCSSFILDRLAEKPYAAFILCGTDIPWEYDPLREHPEHRDQLYELYLQHLHTLKVPFLEVKGAIRQRQDLVSQFLSSLESEAPYFRASD